MESNAKTGKVYLQSHKSGKKWKPVWLSLFPQSSSGIGRLEIQDMGGGDRSPGIRRHHNPHVDKKIKVVRLSELLSVVRLPPNAEACPMDNMSAFCVDTEDRALVFAAPKDDCLSWVEKLCHSTFKQGSQQSSIQLCVEENQIYASADKEFLVSVQKTDAATRCDLQGAYWLQVGLEALLLRDTQKKSVVREWPYEMLRRYGKDKSVLTIEAGRRCDSGPGSFIFETPQAEKIFSLIQATIKQKTSLQNQESNTPSNSPSVAKTPDLGNMAAALRDTLRVQDRKYAPSEDSPQAPITLMPLPSIPTNASFTSNQEAVYADPVDCIQSEPELQSVQALYVDPASVLPIRPPGSKQSPPDASSVPNCQDCVYSEVYDKICAVEVKHAHCAHDEPIYSEPVGEKVSQAQSKPDPFAHLYAQVRKAPAASRPPPANAAPSCTAETSAAADQAADDIIYENMGII
eukprot:XP_003972160.1 PREDICTED: docking protein 3-like isoform X1 [Takifugu rubripes]